MKNLFEWQNYEYCYQQKDDKYLENTDHTTGNAFTHVNEDPFNNNECRLILNQNDQRIIHCDDQDKYLNDSNQAQDLYDLEDDQEEKLIHKQSQQNRKQEFSLKENAKEVQTQENIVSNSYQQPVFKSTDILTTVQKGSNYKLSRKWKQKMDSVLEQKSINEFSAKHNRNMAKFFVRLFSKYLKTSTEKQEFSADIKEKLQEISDKNCISLKDLESLFGGQNSRASRQFLSKILRTKLKQEVIKSQDVQNKAAYLLCSKVYALRCRSRYLIGRLQSR